MGQGYVPLSDVRHPLRTRIWSGCVCVGGGGGVGKWLDDALYLILSIRGKKMVSHYLIVDLDHWPGLYPCPNVT